MRECPSRGGQEEYRVVKNPVWGKKIYITLKTAFNR